MKIIVQHKQTKQFLIDTKTWTEKADEARRFPTAINACLFTVHNGLAEVDIVGISPEPDRHCPYFVQVCA